MCVYANSEQRKNMASEFSMRDEMSSIGRVARNNRAAGDPDLNTFIDMEEDSIEDNDDDDEDDQSQLLQHDNQAQVYTNNNNNNSDLQSCFDALDSAIEQVPFIDQIMLRDYDVETPTPSFAIQQLSSPNDQQYHLHNRQEISHLSYASLISSLSSSSALVLSSAAYINSIEPPYNDGNNDEEPIDYDRLTTVERYLVIVPPALTMIIRPEVKSVRETR